MIPAQRLLRQRPQFYTISLALLSGGSLFLEIALTRLFSTVFYPPYVFAIISLAILGIGLGAALAAWRARWRNAALLPSYLVLSGLLALILLLVTVWAGPYDLYGGVMILVPLPYIFVGLALATFFSTTPEESPRLYRADLLGAGGGVLLSVPLLNWLGGLNGVLFATLIFGVAALINTRTWLRSAVVLTVFSLIALWSNLWIGWLDVDMGRLSIQKPITNSLSQGGRLLASYWDAFARTDLVDPGDGKPYELYIDGAAGSVMPPADDRALLRSDIGFFPFATNSPARVMVIGPGGGLDVWFALNGRTQETTAVEINPASVALVDQFAAYHGDLYQQPGVRIVVDEGRSVLRREEQLYDLIYLSQVVTLVAERNGYALTENTIYTIEAFKEYLAHLHPGGQIALKLYDELTLTRAVVTAVTAVAQMQAVAEAEAMRHVAVFLDPDADPPVPLLVIQREPFLRENGLAYAGVAAQVGFVPLFVPGVAGSPALEAVLDGSGSLADIVAASPSDVSVTTDDRPFFYQFERGLPESLQNLFWVMTVVLLLGSVTLIVLQRGTPRTIAWYMPLYFAALGLGFMTLEVAVIQQTRLFLGHPTLAVALVLGVLLLGGGLGSGWAGRWTGVLQRRRLSWVLGGIVVLTLVWWLGWPWISQWFRAAPRTVRMTVVAASLAPMALLLGIPFPLGLRMVGRFEAGSRLVALAWAINGVMTVFGSLVAVSLAMLAGFGAVLLVGMAAYGVAGLIILLIRFDPG